MFLHSWNWELGEPGCEVSRNLGSSTAWLWGCVLLQTKFTVTWLDTHLSFLLSVPISHMWVDVRECREQLKAKAGWGALPFSAASDRALPDTHGVRLSQEFEFFSWYIQIFQCLFFKKKVICSTMDVVQNIYFLFQNTQYWVHCSLPGGTTAALLSQSLRNKSKQVVWSISHPIGRTIKPELRFLAFNTPFTAMALVIWSKIWTHHWKSKLLPYHDSGALICLNIFNDFEPKHIFFNLSWIISAFSLAYVKSHERY